IETQRHRSDTVTAVSSRQPKGQVSKHQVAKHNAQDGAWDHPVENKAKTETIFAERGSADGASEENHDGDVIEHQAKEGVDVTAAGPAISTHAISDFQ